MQKSQSLPYDIDGDCVYELSYDKENIMKSSLDGRPWKQWNSSKRAGFNGIRRITSCGGTYECRNSRCPYRYSFSTANKVQFKKLSEDVTACSCCGYQAVAVPCVAKKAWEFHDDKVLVYHCGRHSCTARKESCPDITESAKRFFHNNTSAKPSQFPYERLRGMLKEGKSVQEIYSEAKVMANLKKIQNIKQKVIQQENPAEHTFEALAKIKEASDSIDKFLLWSVKDGRVSDLTAVFRSSKERIDIACQMQRGNSHPLAEEYCFLDAEHNKVKGLKTINLTVQHPSLKECVTIASMDCETESTQTFCEFWKQLNSALREYTGERTYIFDPEGIITDEHGGNRESICHELKPDMVERSKSCEMHFYDCAHRVSKANWSPKSKKDFITMVHGIYTSETPGAYEARRRALLDWAQKEKRSHFKPWFNNFWHAKRFHVFRAFKDPSAPNTNMAEVTRSRNATRGAKNDTLARVAEDHIVQSALLKAKIESIKNGQYLGGRCADQKRKDDISLRRQLDRTTQFAKDLKEGAFSEVQYSVGPYVKEKSGHRAKSDDLCLYSSSEEEATPSQKNAKKAFRKRGTRSQNFKESLAMAKKAKLKLVQIHHVSPVKKIFELDHDGRIRLTEIAETVSCNCSFGSRRDLCLHVIWVMMNLLKVNENDVVLHQKSHSKDTVRGLFRVLAHNIHSSATTTNPELQDVGVVPLRTPVNQALNIASANAQTATTNQGANMVPLRTPVNQALNFASANAQTAITNQGANMVLLRTPVNQALNIASANAQTASTNQGANMVPLRTQNQLPIPQVSYHPYTKQPWHNTNPFILHCIDNRIKKCAACPFEFRDPLGPSFLGVVIQHKEKDYYFKNGLQHLSVEQNRYYHADIECIKARHPYFRPALVRIPPEVYVTLSDYERVYLAQRLGLHV